MKKTNSMIALISALLLAMPTAFAQGAESNITPTNTCDSEGTTLTTDDDCPAGAGVEASGAAFTGASSTAGAAGAGAATAAAAGAGISTAALVVGAVVVAGTAIAIGASGNTGTTGTQ